MFYSLEEITQSLFLIHIIIVRTVYLNIKNVGLNKLWTVTDTLKEKTLVLVFDHNSIIYD